MSSVPFILIRHGEQNAGWDVDRDPALSARGQAQAVAMATAIGAADGRALVTSPLRRARETAAALESPWGLAARVEPLVAELPSDGLDLGARGAWLKGVLSGRWTGQAENLLAWRSGIVGFLSGLTRPTVIVSHFVVINAVVGHATGDDRVMPVIPDHCSINRFMVEDGAIRLVELGAQRESLVG